MLSDVEVSGFIDLEMQLLRCVSHDCLFLAVLLIHCLLNIFSNTTPRGERFSRQKSVISNGFDFLLKLAQSNESVMSISFAREALVLMHSLVPLCCGSEAGVAMGLMAEAIAARQEKVYREMLFEEHVPMLILQTQGEMRQRHTDKKQKREGKEEGKDEDKEEENREADKCEEWEIWKRVFYLVYGNLVEEMELSVEDVKPEEKGGGREERRKKKDGRERRERRERRRSGEW
ncbi:uncharacterized protein MONOS_8961 [Monocercomonoides exilis]|uniref:uncharacterized protein n=1 Tax=Monocercomonoides exilis TaxID=2049356 RepID=UPI003559E369|nr:hypothetical protein MONOS_8961 [Monocercomonoides exilis]|eukprot:MONOS_8961.1-p1 / transcript=MONOS_8961.1 / gene=MONOS_8961 / organism=Monocercomonoides_exilis_PA203 / gene_product=unspecified product / transcript_product=unspecified product / location=Mono_scaffold00353:43831-44526(-) / protein_length=232 / sequence_SO=supercontig / SO=protein_coding / is_pseudo=false